MKLILFIMINYFYLIQIYNCKKFRFYMHDELLEYEIDKSVKSYKEVFSIENMELEQIDDENIIVAGHVDVIKSFDPNFPLQVILKTQALEQSVWKDQPIALSWADGCKEFLNKNGFWYNITKLWDSSVCPPQKGVKMNIERQNCTILLDLPKNIPAGQWRAFIMIVQATPMGKTTYGFGVGSELVEYWIIGYEIDKNVKSYKELFSKKNLELEQIDDENILVGGYIDVLKSFDLNTPIQVLLRTQALEQSVWKDQPIALSWADGCKEFLNKNAFWYNFTKLWDSKVCPPRKGGKMRIERQNCTGLLDLPNNLPGGEWRAFILIIQPTLMGITSFGFGIAMELVVV